jgi:hypothetical protein
MSPDAPAFLIELEQSGLGAAIRQSLWVYPAANVGHILGLVVFAAAVAVMDLRLLGAFAATPPATVVFAARRVAIGAFLVQFATGSLLFIAEASHIALNPVFQAKAVLILLGLANALLLGRLSKGTLDAIPAYAPLPQRLRIAAAGSLAIWLAVAAAGRLIAYA